MLKKLITISIITIASLQAATTYNKSLSDGNDDLNYWSDTTSSNLTNHTLVGATEVFTIGSRENIPNIPNSSIKVTTNKLCSDDRLGQVSCSKSDSLEPRYTDDGLATSGEVNLRTWYKATTPKSVNGVVDDPCPTLSNTGSVVNWWTDFGNLRCERTITIYTNKVNSTIYTNKIPSYNTYSAQRSLIWQNAWYQRAEWGVCGVSYCTDAFGNKLGEGSLSSYYGLAVLCVFDKYVCLSGGSLSGSSCVITTQVCPDASWTSATATTCSKVIQICPDSSWTDNGTNCRKNVPEYKLFSTF